MTLILNEIHLLDGLNKTVLVAAADRRISKPDRSYDSTRKKLFPIPYLNGAISYFGLAAFPPKGTTKLQYLSNWLPNFINEQSEVSDLQTFAQNLRDELHEVIPLAILQENASGFHICGYNSQGLPDFWYFSNIGRMEDFEYLDLKPRYDPPSSHFLERDARKEFGWDGSNPSSVQSGNQLYRNGDIRAHVTAWKTLDYAFSRLFTFPNFKQPSSLDEYGEYVKFKFEVIAYFYKKWAKKEIIARPIDVFIYSNTREKQSGILERVIDSISDTRGGFFPTTGSSGSSLALLEDDLSWPTSLSAGSASAEGFPYDVDDASGCD